MLLSRIHFLPFLGTFCVLLERAYVRVLAAIWRVHPESLLDREYYLARNPDVARSGIDPLLHFLRYGAAEGRQPHPLFDPLYYLQRYPDVARSRQNPLLHFLRFGGIEGRGPHPDFDSAFYLADNPDVAAARTNPLVHFMEVGSKMGRLPHPDFDPALYLLANPDVAAANLDPIRHFAEHGAAEGRPTRKISPPPECFLPVEPVRGSGVPERKLPDRKIDVIIPIFKGLTETTACLESVLASNRGEDFRIVAVNDSSPDQKITEYLNRLAREGRITLIENTRNVGFVESVNTGMRASDRDVVLLNSDTLVFGDWLNRLRACAYAEPNTATVTPFSNNATICSYPDFCADNHMSPSTDLAALDAAFALVNRGRSVEIPTAVGFCMYIRRECLNQTGLFDAEAYGLGYGEENDFCMRSAAKGWKHKLACDVFVYHAGSVSFGAASTRQQAGMRQLLSRYPGYSELVRRHVQADPALAFRIAVTAYRLRTSGKQVFLAVVHALGGGVAEHVRRLAQATRETVIWLTLRPVVPGSWILECQEEACHFSLSLDARRDGKAITAVLRACGVARIHIHHLMGYDRSLAQLIGELDLPFDFTVHDYYTLCPQVTMSDEHGRYCGEPDEKSCNHCIARRPPADGPMDISSWRTAHAWVLRRADRVIAPSADAARRISRYFPDAHVIAAEHSGFTACGLVQARPLSADEFLRVAVLGTQTIHKGLELLQECAEEAASSEWPIEFVLVGSVETALRRNPSAFPETGRYENGELPAILEKTTPHLVWFPTRVPETYSYTLSTCLSLGLPVAAHDVGAFPERLGRRPWSWILPPDASAREWAAFFLRVRRDHFLTGQAPVPPEPRSLAQVDFYPSLYLSTKAEKHSGARSLSHRLRRRITVAATLASHDSGQIQACGYVRVIQPLTHPLVAETVKLTLRSAVELAATDADIILVQRVAIQDTETAERVIDACRRRGSRLVLETDDDLFQIPPEHPERNYYSRITQAARLLARKADAILTSTEPLRQRMLAFNTNSILLPNFLDERLWLSPYRRGAFPPDEIRVLYAGTISHRPDLEFLGQAVRRLRPRTRERIRFDVAGVADEDTDWFHAVRLPGASAASYPRFVEWIRRHHHWHWGVAPLLDTPFNRSKSALKFWEYSALDLAAICSDVSVYRDAVQPGETGILAANDPNIWRDALEMAVGDEALWNRLRDNSREAVRKHTIAAHAEEIQAVWMAIADAEKPSPVGAET